MVAHGAVQPCCFSLMYHMCVHFEGNQEAPVVPAPGAGSEANVSEKDCQPSAEMKGECGLIVCFFVVSICMQLLCVSNR